MSSSAPPTIFVIDEDDASRRRLCAELRACSWYAAGFTPSQICHGAPPSAADCIVLDVSRSASIAVQVLAALHLREVTTPVVAITAQIDAELIIRARARNVRAVVRRPFDIEVLCTTILQVIGRRTVRAEV